MRGMRTSRTQVRSILQHNETFLLEGAVTIPAVIRSTISGLLGYLRNVDIDGHGTWEPVGGMGNRFLVQRTIYRIEETELYRVQDPSRGVLYGIGEGESFRSSSTVEPYTPEDKRAIRAFHTALENLRTHGGWEPDAEIPEDWKDPPETLPLWRPIRFER